MDTLSPENLCRQLHGAIPLRSLYAMLEDGRIPAQRVGRRWILQRSEALAAARRLAAARELLRGGLTA